MYASGSQPELSFLPLPRGERGSRGSVVGGTPTRRRSGAREMRGEKEDSFLSHTTESSTVPFFPTSFSLAACFFPPSSLSNPLRVLKPRARARKRHRG